MHRHHRLQIPANFVNPKHTVMHAARAANNRGCYLRVEWTIGNGLLVQAVLRKDPKEVKP